MVGGHGVVETLECGLASVAALLDPPDPQTEGGAADPGQVQDRGGMAHPAAVLAGGDVQPQMEPVLDAPMGAVGLGHLEGGETFSRARSDQPVGFDPVGPGPRAITGAGLARGLRHGGKEDLFGRGRKADQTAGFEPAAIEFNPLNEVHRGRRGKRRPRAWAAVAARCRPRRVGCL